MRQRSGVRLLGGLRIVDLTDDRAGFCSKLLADLGARVTRIERPQTGAVREGAPQRTSPIHGGAWSQYLHANKRSIPLDFEDSRGRRRLLRLLARSDAVVENFAPGYLPRIGLSLADLGAVNPRLIQVSITGFGQTGPRRHYASCDLVQAAFGGQMYVSGTCGGTPLPMHGGQSYYAASLYGAIGLLLGLARRRCSGQGEHVDISSQEVVASMLDHVLVRYLYEGIVPVRQGSLSWNRLSFIARCRDGFLQMYIGTQWEALVEWLDSEGMAAQLKDAAWNDERHRFEHIDQVIGVIERWTASHGVEELFHAAQARRFPWAPVASPGSVPDSAQLRARQFFRHGEDDGSAGAARKGDARVAGAPYVFARGRRPTGAHVAPVGKHAVRNARGILSGLRVLDFSWVLSGPYATRILADFGAEVIKVQSAKTARGAESYASGYFSTWNRNKRSITLDMSQPGAADLVLRLVRISDVVLENFSPRVMANWGLGYERFARANPGVVMVSVSSMGQTGPWKDYVGFGPAFHALSGLTHASAGADGIPLGPGFAYGDHLIGLYAALATLAALEDRARSGRGRYVDLSGYEALCTAMGPDYPLACEASNGVEGVGSGGPDRRAAPCGCYRCVGEDRWCVVSVFDDVQWRALCEVTANPQWLCNDAFGSVAARIENRCALDRLLGAWIATRTAEEVVERLQGAGIPAGLVQSAEDLVRDAHLSERRFFAPIEHPLFGERLADRSPIRSNADVQADWPGRLRAAPALGEANDYVFGELLGLTPQERYALERAGVLC